MCGRRLEIGEWAKIRGKCLELGRWPGVLWSCWGKIGRRMSWRRCLRRVGSAGAPGWKSNRLPSFVAMTTDKQCRFYLVPTTVHLRRMEEQAYVSYCRSKGSDIYLVLALLTATRASTITWTCENQIEKPYHQHDQWTHKLRPSVVTWHCICSARCHVTL